MKFILSIIFLLIGIFVVSSYVLEDDQDGTVFERTFHQLHQEPPPPMSVTRANVQTLWIDQKLDHFNDTDNQLWKMRYMSNDEFYQNGAPFFIYVGGEWSISPGSISGGHMYDMAKEHNGYLFYTEHRYYGQSRPTKDTSNDNIKYLHSRQALADLAHFIRTMRLQIPGAVNSKVILTGGSYSATMVTWFKRVYPELVAGCWASSAPLHAKVDFVEYKEVTGESIKLVGGEACYKRIDKGIAEMESLFATKRGAEVKAMLKLCSNFDESSDLDLWTLFSEISDIFAGVVQTHNDGNIEKVCKTIMEGDNDLNGVANYLLTVFGGKSCNDISYKAIIGSISETAFSNSIMRQWIYQTCNEYGWYQTSGSKGQPFGTKFPVTLYTTMCHDAYGDAFTNEFIHKQVDGTNEYFGSLKPEVQNVYFTHGQLDPWRAMGIQAEDEATIIPLYAHCKDFGSISDKDSYEMRSSKLKIAQLVREWLSATK